MLCAMVGVIAQAGGASSALGGVFGLIFSIWCCGVVLGVGQIVVFIVALVQILSRNMPSDTKLLWCVVTFFLPLIGPILWWTIGSKQNPPNRGDGAY